MIEVGEYVRTDYGEIIKIDGSWKYSTDNKGAILFIHITQIPVDYYTRKIIKHSKNIIDLIEVGDYVNDSRVIGFVYDIEKSIKEGVEKKIGVRVEERWDLTEYYENDIKSIVTREQFEAMKYKVEE